MSVSKGLYYGYGLYEGSKASGLFIDIPFNIAPLKTTISSYGKIDLPGVVTDLTVTDVNKLKNGILFVVGSVENPTASQYKGMPGKINNLNISITT